MFPCFILHTHTHTHSFDNTDLKQLWCTKKIRGGSAGGRKLEAQRRREMTEEARGRETRERKQTATVDKGQQRQKGED